MKIIGLMVTYNEEHFIHYSFPALLEIVDEVVVLDGSTDKTREYFSKFPNVHIFYEENYPPMSYRERRQFTLDKARELGGDRFICIDADEIIDVELSKMLRGLLPLLRRGQGISCQWFHIVNNLYCRSDSIDCTMQSIAWVDDGSNLDGRNIIHEDKFPPGHPAQSEKYVFIDRPLLHFGGLDTKYFIQKRMYYKLMEYLDTKDVETVNLTYYRKLDKNTVDFFCKYPMYLSNGILHGPHNPKFMNKIIQLISDNVECMDDFYKLDIWRYEPSIVEYCLEHIDGFDISCIRYNNKNDQIIFIDMTIRQVINLIIHLKVDRIIRYIYRYLLWRIFHDTNSSY